MGGARGQPTGRMWVVLRWVAGWGTLALDLKNVHHGCRQTAVRNSSATRWPVTKRARRISGGRLGRGARKTTERLHLQPRSHNSNKLQLAQDSGKERGKSGRSFTSPPWRAIRRRSMDRKRQAMRWEGLSYTRQRSQTTPLNFNPTPSSQVIY